ncbi:MAG: HPr(Ser) kinase/phosphatase [bacterium]|nr:HPr(Ser) kinase/phosphatase [bacterium]
MTEITVKALFDSLEEALGLAFLDECPEKPAVIHARDVHRPGMALMGFAENFQADRIQVFGESENSFLATLGSGEQVQAVSRVVSLNPPVIFIARNKGLPKNVRQLLKAKNIPVINSLLPAVELLSGLNHHLEIAFQPATECHGTLVDVYGVGLLFTGRSGIGKSECSLDLIERGHRLVADDMVEITRTTDDMLMGRYNELLRHHLEIRGVGPIDVQAVFGIRAIRMQKRIEVEVELEEWDESKDYDRVGMDTNYKDILGVKIPHIIVPLFPGKNITVIAETIALNFMLKIYGYDAAEVLNDRIVATMKNSNRLRNYLQQDPE